VRVEDDEVPRGREQSRTRAAVAEGLACVVVGLQEGDARKRIEQAGCTMQIVERDGRRPLIYAVRVSGRVSVGITGGVVTAAEVG
jgi:hypothetical protein